MEDIKTIKIKPLLGDISAEFGTWGWTKEDFDKHDRYVEQLKKEGKYLTEGEEITINLTPYNSFVPKDTENKFSNFGVFVPIKSVPIK